MTEPTAGVRRIHIILLAVILAVGIFLRITPDAFLPGATLERFAWLHPTPAYDRLGFDEELYRKYVNGLTQDGLTSYPSIIQAYIEAQSERTDPILPPLRFLYIFTAYLWHSALGVQTLESLRQIAALFSIMTLMLAAAFAWRLRGPTWACAIAALMAVAPTQLHMSQHALIDGFFTFWALLALWMLWENFAVPDDWRLLAGYGLSLALLVITKENSFFVWLAFVAVIVMNRWLRFGITTRPLLLVTVAGPLLGVVILIFLSGGLGSLIETYRLLVSKASVSEIAILTGDGPWHRYLVDLLLVSPIVLLLAVGTFFRLNRTMKSEWYMAIFIAASYLVMCNVRNGMNLRYGNIWDMPLRFLAVSQIVATASLARRFQTAIIVGAVALIAAIEFHQYILLAVKYPLYEMITLHLLQALKILKPH